MRLLEIVNAETASNARRKRVATWIERLKQTEAAATAKPDVKPRYFLINYRITGDASKGKGPSDTRRDSLVEIIESLAPLEAHLSTSTWLVSLHIQEADAIIGLLAGPLDPALDGLHVTQSSQTNRAAFGATSFRP